MNTFPEFTRLLSQQLVAQERSATWLARRLKLHPGTVNRWLNQELRPATPELVARIADLLSIHNAKERQRFLLAAGYGYVDSHDASGAMPASPIAAPPLPLPKISPKHNLPLPPTALIGRREDIRTIHDLLTKPSVRLVTIVGTPGVGKTRLSLELAHQLVTTADARFADGVWFVPLAAIHDPALVLSALAQALDLRQSGSLVALEQLVHHLRDKHTLLVLDNFEQIIDAAPDLSELLAHCPTLKLLVTSRSPLLLRGEYQHSLAPFIVPSVEQAEQGSATLAAVQALSAVQLFVSTVQRFDPRFQLTPANATTILKICSRLDGVALAIELAAARLRQFNAEALLTHLEQPTTGALALLTDGPRDLPARHRTLQNAIAWSYDLLDAAAQRLFAICGVFVGGFTYQALNQVAADETQNRHHSLLFTTLQTLLDHSLLLKQDPDNDQTAGQTRYVMLEIIREFAVEQLENQDDVAAIRRRHYETYLHFARTADYHLRREEAGVWLQCFYREQDNLRAAWYWAVNTENFLAAAWLGIAQSDLWQVSGYWREATDSLQQLLPHRHHITHNLRLACFLALCRGWRAIENFQSLEEYRSELVELHAICSLPFLQAAAWFMRAVILAEPTEALFSFQACLSVIKEVSLLPNNQAQLQSDFCFFADTINLQAMTSFRYAIRLIDEVGDYGLAEMLATESLQLFRQMGNQTFIVYALGTLGRLALVHNDIPQAHRYLNEAVTMAITFGNRIGIGDWQPRLGITTFYAGNLAEAHQILAESLKFCLPLGNHEYLARIYGYQAEITLVAGDLGKAEPMMQQSQVYPTKLRWLTVEFVDWLYVAARLATAQQNFLLAAQRFGFAEKIAKRIGYYRAGAMLAQIDAALAIVATMLEPTLFADMFKAGEALSLAEAFATILAAPPI